MTQQAELEIKKTYDWCVWAFSVLRGRLGLNIKLHDHNDVVNSGQIFLFNHFARFETIIPQYLIYQETGAYCRCVAAAELFKTNDTFSKFLRSLGAVPNDLPGLLPFLAAEILRGRKVIVFPEGGMVKDRQVLDERGHYSIYSRSSSERRKHHRGAAVVALILEVFKTRILSLEGAGDEVRLQRWVQALGLDSKDSLLSAARQPTLVVPANITFFPIRVSDNMLRKGVEFFAQELSPKAMEELLIEGNILLKNTDMDIRLGKVLRPLPSWRWWDRVLVNRLFQRVESLDDLFELKLDSGHWVERAVTFYLTRETNRLRDTYMKEMYAAVTIHHNHLASAILLHYLDRGITEIDQARFRRTLYLSIKYLQEDGAAFLHRSLRNPEMYRGILIGETAPLRQFIDSAVKTDLLERQEDSYRLRSKLQQEHGFDEVRLENVIAVYANELEPIKTAQAVIPKAVDAAERITPGDLSDMRFDDECRAYSWNRDYYARERYQEINSQETATESGAPYLLLPEGAKGIGVLLVHGFLASPAELRAFGESLFAQGFPVLGMRLPGHGTSPWDLRERSWNDWLDAVRRNYQILAEKVERVAVVGFSSGGSLALILAAEAPAGLAGVAAVCAPLKFRNRNMVFVPLVHGANKLAQWVPSLEDGIYPFRKSESEHPHINYSHMPVRGLYELRLMVAELERRLPNVQCPVQLMQSSGDHVVDPASAPLILEALSSEEKELVEIDSRRHGILNEEIGDAQEQLRRFLTQLEGKVSAA